MSSGDLTKLARWVIPGWVAFLAFYSFVVVDILFSPTGAVRIFPTISDFFTTMTPVNAILTAILVAAAGVPLGFTIYQVYFFVRWNSPFSRDGLLPPFITGRLNDLKRITRDIQLLQENISAWRKNWINNPLFRRDHGFRWRYIELLFMEASQSIDSRHQGVKIYDRHRYLHEITHTLGASIAAIYFGFLGYFFLKYISESIDLATYALVVFIFTFILLYFLNQENSEIELIEGQRDLSDLKENDPVPAFRPKIRLFGRNKWLQLSIVSPGSLYIVVLGIFHMFLNPVLNPVPSIENYFMRSILTIVGIVIWVKSKEKVSKEIILGDGLVLTLAFVLVVSSLFIPVSYLSWIDWSFFSALMLFLVANNILLRNRRNVNDDMLAMEYYVLRRYLDGD